MKYIFFLLSLVILGSLLLGGCSRKGCVDKDAFNYDSKAQKDDCSCIYRSKLLIWFTPQTADSFYTYFGSNFFYFYIEGNKLGELADFNATSTAPDCSRSSNTVEVFLGSTKSKEMIVNIRTPNYYPDSIVKSVKMNFTANECSVYQLTF